MKQRLITAGKEALWVLMLALALAAAAYALRPGALIEDSGGTGPDGGGQDNEISLEAAAEHFTRGTAVFADARSAAHFLDGHIEGALNLDPAEFDIWSVVVFEQVGAGDTVITYCDGPRCTLSLELAEKLNWLGYEKVFHLKNGWTAWKEEGLPTASGP